MFKAAILLVTKGKANSNGTRIEFSMTNAMINKSHLTLPEELG